MVPTRVQAAMCCSPAANKTLCLLLALLVATFWGIPASAQVNLGRIGGTITDQTGGAIVGAKVTVTDIARGGPRVLTTDAAGAYSAPNLIPGTYSVRVEVSGFKSTDRQDVRVEVGQDIRVDLTLQPGEQSQTVTVSGEAPAINTTNAQLGGTVENYTINEVPVPGRNYLYLLQYNPSIQMRPGGGGPNQQQANGMRGEWNVVVFDGLPNILAFEAASSLGIGFISGGGDQATVLSLDAVQEFNIVTYPKAEYGWRPGGQINIGLKSGTNALHGSAFAFGRSDALEARNAFAAQKPPLQFENFGGSVGGPIRRDKLFYFGSYEGQRYSVGNPRNLNVPSSVAGFGPASSFPDAINDMLKNHGYSPAKLSQLSLNLAGCAVNGASVSCDPAKGLFRNAGGPSKPFAFSTAGGTDQAIGKVDYRINDQHSLFVDYYWSSGSILAPVQNIIEPWWISPLTSSGAMARVGWTWILSPQLLNDFRLGWDRSNRGGDPSGDCRSGSGAPDYANLGFVSGAPLCGFPQVTIAGFANLGQNSGQDSLGDSYRLADSISYTHGNHQFKFGGEGAYLKFMGALTEARAKGTLTFNNNNASINAFTGVTPLQMFLAGIPGVSTLQVGDAHRSVTFRQAAGYAQDDWRLNSRITLNLGVRYEYATQIREKENRLANFDPSSPSGLLQATDSNSLYNVKPWHFAPRLGMAWDVTGQGRTVVRAGFNMAYYETPIVAYFQAPATLQSNPTGFNLYRPDGSLVTTPGGNIGLATLNFQPPITWAVNTPIFASAVNTTPSCGNGIIKVTPPGTTTAIKPPLCSLGAVDPNLDIPVVYGWNLGVQHALSNNLSLDINYVGNHANQTGSLDINQPTPGANTNANVIQERRPYNTQFPYFSSITYLTNYQASNYNALQVMLSQRAFHGLSFTAGYTYAHNLDQNSSEANQPVPMNSLDPGLDYGPGTNDVRHRFTLDGTYAIPGKKSPGQLLEGWQINGAVVMMSRLPYNAIDSSDNISGTSENLDRWSMAGNPSDFESSGRSTFPCYGLTGSTFAKFKNCETVAIPAGATTAAARVVNMPAACVTAASSLPVNPSVGKTGLDSLATYGCYTSRTSVIVPPALGTFGNMGRDMLRAAGFRVWDLSLSKNFTFKERLTAQFRAECFNVLNSVQYSTPSNDLGNNLGDPSTFGASQSTPNIATNSPIIGPGGPRRFQLGLKLLF